MSMGISPFTEPPSASRGQLSKSESKSTYKLVDVYGSSYNGHTNISFGTDRAATPSGSTHSEEN